MKKVENIKFLTKRGVIKQGGNFEDQSTTVDFIEYTLDVVPQGGFTPKDIRDRSRIQEVLDKSKNEKFLEFEDADFENLKPIVESSRWGIRSKDISKFLDQFK